MSGMDVPMSAQGSENMSTTVATKFAVEIVYNGVTETLSVESHEQMTAVLERAENLFHITQNRHLFGLFRANGSEIDLQQSVGHAGLVPQEVLGLRQSTMRGGGR
jgi:hypothetical protein